MLVEWVLEKQGLRNRAMKRQFYRGAANKRDVDVKGGGAGNGQKLSQLMVFDGRDGCCRVGHGDFGPPWGNYVVNHPCILCGAKSNCKSCRDCYCLAGRDDERKYVYCGSCRARNKRELKEKVAVKESKAEFIRNALLEDTTLEMDLLCGLPRKSALDDLMADIYKLKDDARRRFCVMMMDLDHLKIWNEALGHQGADDVIKGVGAVLKKHKEAVNDGRYSVESNDGKWVALKKAWAFRCCVRLPFH